MSKDKTPHWYLKYIGTKYSPSYNCKDFVNDVLKREFNKSLPDNVNSPDVEQTEHLEDGNVALYKDKGGRFHVGVIFKYDNNPYVLHNFIATKSVILTPFEKMEELSLSFVGVYSINT